MNINGYTFQGPYDPSKGFKSDFAGVYLIVDSQNRVVDVGETNSINTRLPNHDRKPCWTRHGGSILYVCPLNGEQERLSLESQIRATYSPSCGER